MAKKKKTLSDYEYDLIWMSYRYCIGRHTIAATTHAYDIITNSYDKLIADSNVCENMAFDIRREIERVLSFSNPKFEIDYRCRFQGDRKYRPLELYVDWFVTNDTDVNDVTSLKFNCNGEYDVQRSSDKSNEYSLYNTISDLLPWQQLASLIDKDDHYIVECKSDEGIQNIECIKTYALANYSTGKYKVVYVPIDTFKTNPHVMEYINEDVIVNIKKFIN